MNTPPMQHISLTCLFGLLLVAAVFVLYDVMGLSFNAAVLITVSVVLLAWLGYALLAQWRLGWWRRISRVMARLEEGEVDTLLVELQSQYTADPTFQHALALSLAYNYQGQGQAAEPLAQEALGLLDDECRAGGNLARLKCDVATGLLCDAWIAQGRYTQAAERLLQRAPHSGQPQHMTYIAVWCYFLAGQQAQARKTLKTLNIRYGLAGELEPQHRLMLAYLRHRLQGATFHPDNLRDQIAAWEDEARRNAGNPFGARLRAILDDVHTAIESDNED